MIQDLFIGNINTSQIRLLIINRRIQNEFSMYTRMKSANYIWDNAISCIKKSEKKTIIKLF